LIVHATESFFRRLLPVPFLVLPAVVQAQFTFTTNDGTIIVTRCTGLSGDVTIPDTINSLPVTSTGDGAFDNCVNLTNPFRSPLQPKTLSGDSLYFSDPTWTNYPARFYRLRSS
jgi:hypothetical protein